MAKREVLEQQMRAEEQERPENGDEQLEHPCRLRTSAVRTTKRKSLYNQEYGVFARDNGYVEIFKVLVRREEELLIGDVDFAERNEMEQNVLFYAATDPKNSVEMMEAILELAEDDADALIHQQDMRGNTPLMLALTLGSDDSVSFLLEQGAKVTDKNYYDETPLHMASSFEMTKLLIERDAPINARNRVGATPLMISALNLNIAEVNLLLENNAGITIKDEFGDTVFDYVRDAKGADATKDEIISLLNQ